MLYSEVVAKREIAVALVAVNAVALLVLVITGDRSFVGQFADYTLGLVAGVLLIDNERFQSWALITFAVFCLLAYGWTDLLEWWGL